MIADKAFIEKNISLIYFIANQHTSDDADELAHEVVVKLLTSRVDIDEDHKSAYLNRMCVNILINRGRDALTDVMTHAESMDASVQEEEVGSLHDLLPSRPIREEQVLSTVASFDSTLYDDLDHPAIRWRQQLENLIAHMSSEKALLFFYRYYWGLQPKELALFCGFTEDKVRSILKRAVKEAWILVNKKAPTRVRHNGMTLQDMYLSGIVEDWDMFPFKMYFSDSLSIMEIAEKLERTVDSVKLSLKLGRLQIEQEYGYAGF